MKNHGALGECFPPRFMKRLHFIEGGGTIPWMGLVSHGLTDPEHLQWGGWSGRFSQTKHNNIYSRHKDIKVDEEEYGDFLMFEADSEEEAWTDPVHGDSFSNCFVPVWRFRRAMFNDFQARMDWCVKPYSQANHNPMAAFNGDKTDTIVHLEAAPSEKVRLDASASSDPDKDGLAINWWVYQEASTYKSDIVIPDHTASVTTLTVPDDALGSQIHVILEVQDDSQIVSLYDYRRIVITIE